MPLRKETKHLYGADWRLYRLRLIELAQNRCARCNLQLPSSRLTGAHLHNDPTDRTLCAVLCFPCHSKYDTPHRVAMTRRTRARRHGQLWLTPGLEYAPYPAWEIPDEIFAGIQESFNFYAADPARSLEPGRATPLDGGDHR